MSRDDQFVEFAKSLLSEVLDNADGLDTDLDIVDGCVMCSLQREKLFAHMTPLIARRAYDLVQHAIETADYTGIRGWIQGVNIPLYYKVVESVPDMPTLPEEGKC